MVIEWRAVPHYHSDVCPDTVTFQVVFFENSSKVLFNYGDVNFGNDQCNGGISSTVGVQVSSQVAREYSYQTASLRDGLSLLWQIPSKLDPPTASITVSGSPTVGAEITLDASDSVDPNGQITSYLWEIESGDLTAVLGTPTNVSTSFKSDVKGETVVRLTITNSEGLQAQEKVSLNITETPTNITVDAGDNKYVREGATVTLQAMATGNTEGGVNFQWQQPQEIEKLMGTEDVSSTLTFKAPNQQTVLRFEVVVTTPEGDSASDTVLVIVMPNQVPVARAGEKIWVGTGDKVVLDGSSSYDSDGLIIEYLWSQVVPRDLDDPRRVTLQSPNKVKSEFVAPTIPGTLSFDLKVVDNDGAFHNALLDVEVVPAPSVNAGEDQASNSGQAITLDGSGSSDPLGGDLSYSWSQVSGPVVTLQNQNSAATNFTLPVVQARVVLVFQLTVTTSKGVKGTGTVSVICEP